MPQLSSWPSFGYTFVSHIFFTLVVHCSGALYSTFAGYLFFFFSFFSRYLYYLFITATYCQFICIYYLINHYVLICSLITLKIYLVYTIISIFYYCWSNYISPQFVLHWKNKLPNFLNRCHTLWYRVSIWLICIIFFMGYTLRPPLWCWSLCYVFIWQHLIMVPRG